MSTRPIYAIAVFDGIIKGNVKFSEDLLNNCIQIKFRY